MFKEKIRIQLLGGSLTDHGSYADGNYQGYPVVITTESTVYHVRINAVSTQDPDNAQLAQYLEYQKQNVKHLADYSCTSTSALLTIKMPAVNGNKVPDMINSVVDPLIQYLLAVTISLAVSPVAAHRNICQIMRLMVPTIICVLPVHSRSSRIFSKISRQPVQKRVIWLPDS